MSVLRMGTTSPAKIPVDPNTLHLHFFIIHIAGFGPLVIQTLLSLDMSPLAPFGTHSTAAGTATSQAGQQPTYALLLRQQPTF